jgi:hypothetical protein
VTYTNNGNALVLTAAIMHNFWTAANIKTIPQPHFFAGFGACSPFSVFRE